jgi:hypothetical protein
MAQSEGMYVVWAHRSRQQRVDSGGSTKYGDPCLPGFFVYAPVPSLPLSVCRMQGRMFHVFELVSRSNIHIVVRWGPMRDSTIERHRSTEVRMKVRPITQSTPGGGGCGKWIRPKKQVRVTGGVGVHLWDDI